MIRAADFAGMLEGAEVEFQEQADSVNGARAVDVSKRS